MPQKLETVLKHVEEISNEVNNIILSDHLFLLQKPALSFDYFHIL